MGTKKAAAKGKDDKSSSAARPVSWDKLKTARGSAKAIPATISALASAKTRSDAYKTLTDALVGEAAFSASGPAISLLADAAKNPRVPHREDILVLVKRMVALGEHSEVFAFGIDLRKGAAKKNYGAGDGKAMYEVARATLPAFVALLADDDAEVRGASAALLRLFHDDAPTLVPSLLEAASRDADDAAAAQMVFAALSLSRGRPELETKVRAAASALQALAGDRPLTVGAASIAAAVQASAIEENEARSRLVPFFRAAGQRARTRREQQLDDPDEAALRWLGESTLGDVGRRVAFSAALAALGELRPARGEALRGTWAEKILGWYFPPRKGSFRAYVSDPVDVAKLKGDARDALIALSSVPNSANSYRHVGLPPDLRSRRRLLGLSPRTVLEDRVGKTKALRWHVLREASDAYDNLDVDKRPAIQAYLQKKYFDDLTSGQWLELWTEVVAGAYGLMTAMEPDPLDAAIAAAQPKELDAWAERYVEEARSAVGDELRPLGRYLALAAARGRQKGDWIPETYDDLIAVGGAHDALEWLSPDRRRRWAERRIAEQRTEAPLARATVLEAIATELLDVVPEATAMLLDELERPDAAEIKGRAAGIAEGFKLHRKRVPLVDETLRARGAKR